MTICSSVGWYVNLLVGHNSVVKHHYGAYPLVHDSLSLSSNTIRYKLSLSLKYLWPLTHCACTYYLQATTLNLLTLPLNLLRVQMGSVELFDHLDIPRRNIFRKIDSVYIIFKEIIFHEYHNTRISVLTGPSHPRLTRR